MTLHAISAHTTHPNTPETDRMAEVWHTVHMSDGTTRQVMAACPLTAIARMNKRIRSMNLVTGD